MRYQTLCFLTCFGLVLTPMVSAAGLSKQEIKQLSQSIEFEYAQQMKVCDTLNWNAADVCEVQAKHKRLVDLAELRANENPTAKTRYAAAMAHVDANHEIAITECNDVPVEARRDCWRSADEAREAGTQKADSFWGMLKE